MRFEGGENHRKGNDLKLNLSSVTVDKIEVSSSKKNTGGAFAKMKLTGIMTDDVRTALGIGNDRESWPPEGETAGKLKGSFATTTIILTADQGDMLAEMNEANIPISLADSFKWKLEDPADETNRTVLYTFWARSADLAAAQLITGYKFSVQANTSEAVISYNTPNDGSKVDMSPDRAQMHLVTQEQREAVAEIPDGEGKAPTHAEKVKQRKAETERKSALRKATETVQ